MGSKWQQNGVNMATKWNKMATKWRQNDDKMATK